MIFVDGYIFIQKMYFHAFHGVKEQERKVGGDYLVDVKAKVDISKAIKSDLVTDTIDYGAIYQIVNKVMEEPSSLVEHVAGRIAEAFFAKFPQTKDIVVKVVKVNPPMGGDCKGAGVELYFTNG